MRLGPKGRLAAWTAGALIALLATAAIVWRSDILQALLDPEIPYPAYEPPPAPDYGEAVSWALLESRDPRSEEAAVYLIETAVTTEQVPETLPVCERANQTGCLVAWVALTPDETGRQQRRRNRALVWDSRGRLVELGDRSIVCVNPLLGRRSDQPAEARLHRGAANATALEWGVRPAFLDRQVAARCRDGFLRPTMPDSDSFDERGSWSDRRKVKPYNLFYADIEHDVEVRLDAWRALNGVSRTPPAPGANRTAPPAP